MLVMRHKTIKVPWRFIESHDGHIERAREAAEVFIDSIGAEKVVSVSERSESFTVTVWYREEGDSRPTKAVIPEL